MLGIIITPNVLYETSLSFVNSNSLSKRVSYILLLDFSIRSSQKGRTKFFALTDRH